MQLWLVVGLVIGASEAFQAARSHATQKLATRRNMGYVPDGISKEEYERMKKAEAAKRSKREFGKAGARGFESRSMQSFVAALEKGEAKHLMPVDPKKVRSGEIALKDVPYMQRGGSWDNSDLKGKKGWMNTGFGNAFLAAAAVRLTTALCCVFSQACAHSTTARLRR